MHTDNPTKSPTPTLMGAAEIAALLGVSRQRVGQLTARADFPAPAAKLAAGKVWNADEITTWARLAGRIGGDNPGT